MSSYKTHDKVTFITTSLIAVALSFFLLPTELLLISLGTLFGGLMFNGDLDCCSKPYKRWWLLSGFWIPYQKLVGKHRSFLSHGPVVGTVIRILWILLICLPLIWIYFEIVLSFCLLYWWEIIVFFIGLEIGSLSHTLMDWIS